MLTMIVTAARQSQWQESSKYWIGVGVAAAYAAVIVVVAVVASYAVVVATLTGSIIVAP